MAKILLNLFFVILDLVRSAMIEREMRKRREREAVKNKWKIHPKWKG